MGIGRERLIPSVTGFEHRRLADRCDPIPRRMWAVPTPSRDLPITPYVLPSLRLLPERRRDVSVVETTDT